MYFPQWKYKLVGIAGNMQHQTDYICFLVYIKFILTARKKVFNFKTTSN